MSNLTDPSSPSTGETRAFDDELDAATCQFPIHRGRRPRIRPVLSPRAARTTRVTPPRVGQLQTPKSKSNGIVDQTFETGDLAYTRRGSTASIAFAHHTSAKTSCEEKVTTRLSASLFLGALYVAPRL